MKSIHFVKKWKEFLIENTPIERIEAIQNLVKSQQGLIIDSPDKKKKKTKNLSILIPEENAENFIFTLSKKGSLS